jgi:hypothetical protein
MTDREFQSFPITNMFQVNVVSAWGHFASWIVQVTLYVCFASLKFLVSADNINVISHCGFLLPSIYFVVFPTVQEKEKVV